MCRLLLVTIACLAILFGISGLYMMPKMIQTKIEERMQLKIGTKNFDRFTRVPIPIKVKFYLFNVTNSEQVMRGLERPHFEEVGPFMYEQWRRRRIIDIIDNNRKIVYHEYKTFYSLWPPSMESDKFKYLDSPPVLEEQEGPVERVESAQNSWPTWLATEPAGPDRRRAFMLNPNQHNVTVINLPLLSVLTKLADLEEGSLKRNIAARIVSRLIKEGKERILITRPVNELLFDGYKVGVMEAARELVSTTLGYNFESPLPRNKFGFFYGKNGTWKRDEAGELTVFTGRNESMNDFMLVDNWNGLRRLNTWPRNTEAGDRCNEIHGTDGSQFHPGVTRDHVLGIFSPMICTSIQVKYKEDTSCRDIPLLRFTTTAEMFAAPKKLPRNACYCTIREPRAPSAQELQARLQASWGGPAAAKNLSLEQATATTRAPPGEGKARITNSRCYIDGLLDLGLCQKGAPVAASPPHFYNGDPMLAMAAGLRPNKSLHETQMDIEPMTGAVMRAASRAQLNAYVERAALEVVEADLIGHMTPMVAPMLWFEEAAEIDEPSAADFKRQLLDKVQKGRRSFLLAILFGLLLALTLGVQYWYVNCYKLDSELKARRQEIARKKREAAELRSAKARRARSSSPGSRGARSARRAVGARKSNLAQMNMSAKRPLVELTATADQDERLKRAGAAAVAVAAALGAADAAVVRNQRQQLEGKPGGRVTKRGAPASSGRDEDAVSRHGLVDNEWGQTGEANTTASSSNGAPSTSGRGDLLEPSTSDGLLGDERAPSCNSSICSDDD